MHAELATDETLTAHGATSRVRVALAARRLYQLRQAQRAGDNGIAGGRFRRAERRARAALVRASFTDPAAAAEVLRQVQILALTPALAALGYTTPDAAHAAMANLIGASRPPHASPWPAASRPGQRALAVIIQAGVPAWMNTAQLFWSGCCRAACCDNGATDGVDSKPRYC